MDVRAQKSCVVYIRVHLYLQLGLPFISPDPGRDEEVKTTRESPKFLPLKKAYCSTSQKFKSKNWKRRRLKKPWGCLVLSSVCVRRPGKPSILLARDAKEFGSTRCACSQPNNIQRPHVPVAPPSVRLY
ncbi:hypothetical protein SKAU_G00189500 [Synaphobranchus kaupii]|uniref:Uncharacterized protein n=1 Tax=Synaphobranchus kaupii TaxID=118154 RepID=A0A9Q1IWR0_SYNKA|nr:hypothetical protein SKAU_G00189500 [Synaphobranchus kaupii]